MDEGYSCKEGGSSCSDAIDIQHGHPVLVCLVCTVHDQQVWIALQELKATLMCTEQSNNMTINILHMVE